MIQPQNKNGGSVRLMPGQGGMPIRNQYRGTIGAPPGCAQASTENGVLCVTSRPPGKRPGVAGGFLRPQMPTRTGRQDKHPFRQTFGVAERRLRP